MTIKSKYCNNSDCSRPATEEEYRLDYGKRLEAIERATVDGTHSAKQIENAHKILETFKGYRRCTR